MGGCGGGDSGMKGGDSGMKGPPARSYPLWVALCDCHGCLLAPVSPLRRRQSSSVSVSLLRDLVRDRWAEQWLKKVCAARLRVLPPGVTDRGQSCLQGDVLVSPLVTSERWPVVVLTSESHCPQCSNKAGGEWCAARLAQLDWWARRPEVTRWVARQGPGGHLLPHEVPPWPNSHYKAD